MCKLRIRIFISETAFFKAGCLLYVVFDKMTNPRKKLTLNIPTKKSILCSLSGVHKDLSGFMCILYIVESKHRDLYRFLDSGGEYYEKEDVY